MSPRNLVMYSTCKDQDLPFMCGWIVKIISAAREYPQNAYLDLKYFIRLMYDNWLRLYTVLTPHHALFFHDNVDPREVPEDPANFHLSQINS